MDRQSAIGKFWRPFSVEAHGGGIDGNGARLGRGINLLARVELERLEVLGELGHVDNMQLGLWSLWKVGVKDLKKAKRSRSEQWVVTTLFV
jgi:hypothetical protein